MRRITTVALASLTIAGCYLSHENGRADGSVLPPRDGSPDSPPARDGSIDAPIDAPGDAALDAPAVPRCDRPLREWALESFSLEGLWSSALLARDGESRWLVAGPGDGGPVRALALDPGSPLPLPSSEVLLTGTEGGIVLAADGDRFRIVTVTHDSVLWVHDAGGALLSREDLPPADGYAVALLGLRIGLVAQQGSDVLAEVRDVAGGPALSSTTLAGWTFPGIGEGRALFAMIASDGATSHYFGLDELGLVRAATLGVVFQAPRSDGTTFVWVGQTSIELRFAGGRIEERALPPGTTAFRAPTVADGRLGAIVATGSDTGVWISIDSSGEWLRLDELTMMPLAQADQAALRVGAYFLEGDTVRWSGLTCRR